MRSVVFGAVETLFKTQRLFGVFGTPPKVGCTTSTMAYEGIPNKPTQNAPKQKKLNQIYPSTSS
jgi:hypothetical protein